MTEPGAAHPRWQIAPPQGEDDGWTTYVTFADGFDSRQWETENEAVMAAVGRLREADVDLHRRLDFDSEAGGTGIAAAALEDLLAAFRVWGLTADLVEVAPPDALQPPARGPKGGRSANRSLAPSIVRARATACRADGDPLADALRQLAAALIAVEQAAGGGAQPLPTSRICSLACELGWAGELMAVLYDRMAGRMDEWDDVPDERWELQSLLEGSSERLRRASRAAKVMASRGDLWMLAQETDQESVVQLGRVRVRVRESINDNELLVDVPDDAGRPAATCSYDDLAQALVRAGGGDEQTPVDANALAVRALAELRAVRSRGDADRPGVGATDGALALTDAILDLRDLGMPSSIFLAEAMAAAEQVAGAAVHAREDSEDPDDQTLARETGEATRRLARLGCDGLVAEQRRFVRLASRSLQAAASVEELALEANHHADNSLPLSAPALQGVLSDLEAQGRARRVLGTDGRELWRVLR